MHLHIPTVYTERLALVPIAEAHFEMYAFLYGDPVMMEHIGPTMDRTEAWKRMARQAGHWVLRGYGGWSVQVRESGEIVGWTGIMYPEGNRELEIGWMIRPESWGKGYATEAAGSALAYAFDTVGAQRIMARITPGNTGSISVAHKLGMALDTELSDEETSYYFAHRPADVKDTPAQATLPGFIVIEYEVTDPAGYKEYLEGSRAVRGLRGGTFLVRGASGTSLSGEPPKTVAILQFPSVAEAVAFDASPEYSALKPNRDKSIRWRSFVVEGLPQ